MCDFEIFPFQQKIKFIVQRCGSRRCFLIFFVFGLPWMASACVKYIKTIDRRLVRDLLCSSYSNFSRPPSGSMVRGLTRSEQFHAVHRRYLAEIAHAVVAHRVFSRPNCEHVRFINIIKYSYICTHVHINRAYIRIGSGVFSNLKFVMPVAMVVG